MTLVNRDRVVTDFRKVKDVLTKSSVCLERPTPKKACELKLLDRRV